MSVWVRSVEDLTDLDVQWVVEKMERQDSDYHLTELISLVTRKPVGVADIDRFTLELKNRYDAIMQAESA